MGIELGQISTNIQEPISSLVGTTMGILWNMSNRGILGESTEGGPMLRVIVLMLRGWSCLHV